MSQDRDRGRDESDGPLLRDLVNEEALTTYETMKLDNQWVVHTRPNAQMSRTGHSLEHYPINRCTPSLEKFLFMEVRICLTFFI